MAAKPTHPTACPSWCAGDHPTGAVHRVEIGRATVGGERVLAVVLQAPGSGPSVVISGAVYVAISDDDHEDAARLFDLSGQPVLAGLVRRASEVAKGVTSGSTLAGVR